MNAQDLGTARFDDRTVVWSPPDKLPAGIRIALMQSVQALNALIAQGAVDPMSIDLGPFHPFDEPDNRSKPCNANAAEWHWWGYRVWLSDDIIKGITGGSITAGGIAALFGGPPGELIGFAVAAAGTALGIASGPCGIRFDVTWVGVPVGFQRRS